MPKCLDSEIVLQTFPLAMKQRRQTVNTRQPSPGEFCGVKPDRTLFYRPLPLRKLVVGGVGMRGSATLCAVVIIAMKRKLTAADGYRNPGYPDEKVR